jgi:hypothetical protein
MTDRYVNWPPPTEDLTPLIEAMARASARVSHEKGIGFDMDNPEVARAVILATFDGLFPPTSPSKGKKVSRNGSSKTRNG